MLIYAKQKTDPQGVSRFQLKPLVELGWLRSRFSILGMECRWRAAPAPASFA